MAARQNEELFMIDNSNSPQLHQGPMSPTASGFNGGYRRPSQSQPQQQYNPYQPQQAPQQMQAGQQSGYSTGYGEGLPQQSSGVAQPAVTVLPPVYSNTAAANC